MTTIGQGLRERLLCGPCEQMLGQHESYFARLWFGGPVSVSAQAVSGLRMEVDYRKVKLLLLSIVWRASASRLLDFEPIDLGEHHEPIRKMLLSGTAAAAGHYRIYVQIAPEGPATHLMSEPWLVRLGRHNTYNMVFGGAVWTILMTPWASLPIAAASSLRENGQLVLTPIDLDRFLGGTGAIDAIRRFPLE